MNSINESEQNDSLITADDLTLGDTLTGQLSNAEDLDGFRRKQYFR